MTNLNRQRITHHAARCYEDLLEAIRVESGESFLQIVERNMIELIEKPWTPVKYRCSTCSDTGYYLSGKGVVKCHVCKKPTKRK